MKHCKFKFLLFIMSSLLLLSGVTTIFANSNKNLCAVEADTAYTVSDFVSENIYNRFNGLINSGAGEQLTRNTLKEKNIISLDLSGLEIESVDFLLEKFDITALQYLNLTDNNLQNDDLTKVLEYSRLSDMTNISLMDNNFSLEEVGQTNLDNEKLIWGVQNTSALSGLKINEKVTLNYYYKNSDNSCYTLTIQKDGASIKPITSTSHSLTGTGNYSIAYTAQNGHYFKRASVPSKTYTFSQCEITLKTPLLVYERRALPYPITLSDLVEIKGVAAGYSSLTTSVDASVTTTENQSFDIIITNTATNQQLKVLKQFYKVEDKTAPTVTFYTDEQHQKLFDKSTIRYITLGNDYLPLYYEVFDLGQEIETTPTIQYFLVGESSNTAVDSILTNSKASYIVKYTFEDASHNQTIIEINYRIVAQLVDPVNFTDKKLYDEIALITGENAVFEDSLESLNYIDFSANNITSVKGLEKLVLKNDVVIDFSKNNLSNVEEITTLLTQKSNIKTIILMFNNFSVTTNLNTKIVYGAQKVGAKDYYVEYKNVDDNFVESVPTFCLVNDYSAYFTMNETKTNTVTLGTKNYGSFSYSFVGKSATELMGHNYQGGYVYGLVTAPQGQTIEVKSSHTLTQIVYTGLVSSDFTYQVPSVNTNTLGQKNADYEIKLNGNVVAVVRQVVTVVDTISPQIRLKGNATINVKKSSSYSEPGVTITDNYSTDITPTITYKYKKDFDSQFEPSNTLDITKTGIYEIKYYVEDSSGNHAEITRIVNVGNIEYVEPEEIQFGDPYTPQFVYYIFSENNFTKQYKYDGEATYKTLNGPISINNVGSPRVLFKLVGLQMEFNFEFNLVVVDEIQPTLNLLGMQKIYYHAGETYVENGCTASDNSTILIFNSSAGHGQTSDGKIVVTKTIYTLEGTTKTTHTSIVTDKKQTYFVEYKAVDMQGNETIKTREVIITNPIITSVKLSKKSFSNEYKVGSEIEFDIDVEFAVNLSTFSKSDVTFEWYINGVRDTMKTSSDAVFLFDEVGLYSVSVYAISYSQDGTVIRTPLLSPETNQEIEKKAQATVNFIVIGKSVFDDYGWYIFAGVGGIILIFVIAIIIRRKRVLY